MFFRIQTFYFIILAIFTLFVLIVNPFIIVGKEYLTIWDNYEDYNYANLICLSLIGVSSLYAVVHLFKVPQLKLLEKQLFLTKFNFFWILIFIISFLLNYFVINFLKSGDNTNYLLVIFIPIFYLVFNFLAFLAIKKDINLLSSADRLR